MSLLNNVPIFLGAELERLYLFKPFYGLKLGLNLLKFNVELSKYNRQAGLWLYTRKENNKAIEFYKKNGFIITGSYEFKISENLYNPNYQMFLTF